MRKNIVVLFLAIVLALGAGFSWAGPFGTEMGDTIEKFSELEPLEKHPNTYTTSQMPATNSDFFLYVVTIPKKYGLTFIQANSNIFENDSYGIQAKHFFADIEKALTKKYGKPEKFDRLVPGSIWKEPKYWLVGIAKKERYYSVFWTFKKPRENISAITLSINAINNTSSVVRLSYEYVNHKSYLEEMKKKKDDTL